MARLMGMLILMGENVRLFVLLYIVIFGNLSPPVNDNCVLHSPDSSNRVSCRNIVGIKYASVYNMMFFFESVTIIIH